MKSFVITLGVLCLGIAAAVTYSNFHHAAPSPITETAADPSPASAKTSAAQLPSTSIPPVRSNDHSFLAPVHRPGANLSADPAAQAFRDSIALLGSRATTFQQREAIWKQLREGGQLDQAIAALKQAAADNPDSAEYQTALGRANLQKAGVVAQSGGNMNELGILGMTADQSFDAALKIDPANWDAQFFKAVSMSYWPAELNKGDEVVQRFSNLINQQETMPSSQSEYAMPYIRLGDQYQKLGQTDNALQTWQAGAARFPNDPTLQQKLASPPSHP